MRETKLLIWARILSRCGACAPRASLPLEICLGQFSKLKTVVSFLPTIPFNVHFLPLPRGTPRGVIIIIRFRVSSRFAIPSAAIFFLLHYAFVFRILLLIAKYANHRLSSIFPAFLRYTVLLSLRPSLPPYTSPHSLSSPFCFYIRQFYSFFFSRGTQPILLFYIVFSRISALPSNPALPSLARCHFFFISFSPRQASLYLPTYLPTTARICMRESNLGCYGKHNVQRERERWRNVNQLCRVHPLVKPKLSGFIAPICLAVL